MLSHLYPISGGQLILFPFRPTSRIHDHTDQKYLLSHVLGRRSADIPSRTVCLAQARSRAGVLVRLETNFLPPPNRFKCAARNHVFFFSSPAAAIPLLPKRCLLACHVGKTTPQILGSALSDSCWSDQGGSATASSLFTPLPWHYSNRSPVAYLSRGEREYEEFDRTGE